MEDALIGRCVGAFLSQDEQRCLRMVCRRWYFTSTWLQYGLRRPLHKKSPLNLHGRPFQHQWQQFIKANCKVFLDRLVQFLPPASKEETYRLKMGLCKSTNTGVRPSFDNANARTGYIVDKMNRCGNLPNVLLTEEMSDMRTDLFGSRSSRHWNVALYGGGPGFDSIGLEFLANFLRVPDQTFETIVYDNEPGWADAVSGVRRTMETLGFSRSSWEFKPCDITEDLTTAMNAGVGADASLTDLFVFSFVCVENFRLLESSDYIFLRSLFSQARTNSYFVFTDSTHRLWPLIWDVAKASASFRIWTPHARGCHYALVLKKLRDGHDPSIFPFFDEAMTRLTSFAQHHQRQVQSLSSAGEE